MAVAEIVEDGDLMPRMEQLDTGMRTDITGAARDKNHSVPPTEWSPGVVVMSG
jgi:hypothetical protein